MLRETGTKIISLFGPILYFRHVRDSIVREVLLKTDLNFSLLAVCQCLIRDGLFSNYLFI